ncbi:MAG: DUF1559 domain-containing protein [Planctomycetia bacterium]|nr:DUF1559 domain-containing protein [Planctomycetia bacterium]
MRKGFTLIELLVVMLIIGFLASLLLTGVNAARAAARKTQCANNLHNIGLALANYAHANGGFPPNHSNTTGGQNMRGVLVELLPFLEGRNIYDLWNPYEALDHTSNERFVKSLPAGYLCPAAPGGERTMTYKAQGTLEVANARPADYAIIHKSLDASDGKCYGVPLGGKTGPSAVMSGAGVISVDTLTDGLSSTIIFHEHAGLPNVYFGRKKIDTYETNPFSWIGWNSSPAGHGMTQTTRYWVAQYDEGATYTGDSSTTTTNWTIMPIRTNKTAPAGFRGKMINVTNASSLPYAFHNAGANAQFADGSVRFVHENIVPMVYQYLSTGVDGQPATAENTQMQDWTESWLDSTTGEYPDGTS